MFKSSTGTRHIDTMCTRYTQQVLHTVVPDTKYEYRYDPTTLRWVKEDGTRDQADFPEMSSIKQRITANYVPDPKWQNAFAMMATMDRKLQSNRPEQPLRPYRPRRSARLIAAKLQANEFLNRFFRLPGETRHMIYAFIVEDQAVEAHFPSIVPDGGLAGELFGARIPVMFTCRALHFDSVEYFSKNLSLVASDHSHVQSVAWIKSLPWAWIDRVACMLSSPFTERLKHITIDLELPEFYEERGADCQLFTEAKFARQMEPWARLLSVASNVQSVTLIRGTTLLNSMTGAILGFTCDPTKSECPASHCKFARYINKYMGQRRVDFGAIFEGGSTPTFEFRGLQEAVERSWLDIGRMITKHATTDIKLETRASLGQVLLSSTHNPLTYPHDLRGEALISWAGNHRLRHLFGPVLVSFLSPACVTSSTILTRYRISASKGLFSPPRPPESTNSTLSHRTLLKSCARQSRRVLTAGRINLCVWS
jgi:hypothetical protein